MVATHAFVKDHPLTFQVPGEGLFTEGCMVLIEGEYTIEETIRVLAMGHPPSEKRDIARWVVSSRHRSFSESYTGTSTFSELGQCRSKKRYAVMKGFH